MNTANAIEVKGLSKRFGDKVAVDGVDLTMPRGRVWGFLGPNGSGKTTTIRMVCGLLKPSGGSGRCLDFDIVKQARHIKLHTGYMTQHFSFWQDLSIRENLEFVARAYNMPRRREAVDQALEKLALQHRQGQLCGALSGGWKQRLALAAVTMHHPQLLLLDEPTAGVDPQARRDFWEEIHTLASAGMTVLVSTHYMDEAERCDEIVYLANGKLITQGTVADVIAASGLITYQARGRQIRDLLGQIKQCPGVEHAAYFGAALHISGRDKAGLERVVAEFDRPDIQWQAIEPSLEDTFIALMADAGIDRRQM